MINEASRLVKTSSCSVFEVCGLMNSLTSQHHFLCSPIFTAEHFQGACGKGTWRILKCLEIGFLRLNCDPFDPFRRLSASADSRASEDS